MFWVDIETTGLEPDVDRILEVSCQVTDRQGSLIEAKNWIIRQSESREQLNLVMTPKVRAMHTKNGLLDDIYSNPAAVDPMVFRVQFFNFLLGYHKVGWAYPMCGSSVHFDRAFLKAQVPNVEAWFHYRNIDISTLKNLWMLHGGEAPTFKNDLHRAPADIISSIEEYKFYLENFLKF